MTAVKDRTKLVALEGANIPAKLRTQKRWAPWRAQWNAGRSKWDKIPVRADMPEIGLSSASPERWFSYEDALKAHQNAGGMTAGIGFVMTGCKHLVGIDMDNCIDEHGNVATWAQTIVDTVDSYTEISPSGRGLRVFAEGEIDADWNNHSVGVEVYAGHAARFLTVTGRKVAGLPEDVLDATPGSLEGIAEQYRVRVSQASAEDKMPPIPLLLPDESLPDLASLNLPPRAREFLADGTCDGDRSRVVASTAVALFSAGLTQAEVLSVLAGNTYAFSVALEHRRDDPDRATLYLWKHHVLKAEPLASSRMLTAADFDAFVDSLDVDAADTDTSQAEGDDAMFGDLGAAPDAGAKPPAKKAPKFQFIQAAAYAAQERRVAWMIPGVLPKAELGGLYGESGAGKSFFVLDMMVALCAASPWWDKQIQRRHRIAYVAAEGAIGVQDRLKAIAIDRGMRLEDLDLFVLGDSPDIMDGETVKDLLRAMSKLGKLDMIVLDTLAQVTPGANENSSEDMGKALHHAKGLHRATGAMVFLVGHSGKDTTRGQRGWSGLKGAMDVQLLLTRTATYRAATVAKLKDGEGEGVEFMFNLRSVQVGTDQDDNPISSCVVDPVLDALQLDELRKVQAEEKGKRGRKPGTGKYMQPFMTAAQELCGVSNTRQDRNRFLQAARARIEQDFPDVKRADNEADRTFAAALASGQLLLVDEHGAVSPEDVGWYKVKVPLRAPADPGFDDLT